MLLGAVLLLMVLTECSAQNFIRGRGKFQIHVDYARFAAGEREVYTEIYYGLPQGCFTHRGDSGHYAGAVNMRAEIWGDAGFITRREWTVPHVVADTAALSLPRTVVGLETFRLVEGNYRVVITAYDLLETSRHDSLGIRIPAKHFRGPGAEFSDLELATDIHSSEDTSSMFYKNTLLVIPNPGALFGAALPFIYSYVEAYKLERQPENGRFLIRYTVLNASGDVVLHSERAKERVSGPSVSLEKLNVTALKSGTYLLRVELRDSLGREYGATSKRFYIYKPGTLPDTTRRSLPAAEYSASEYMMMTDDELTLELQEISYAATPAERKQSESLRDIASKRKFLFEFWARRDPDPGTSENEYKIEYHRRLLAANAAYATTFRAGWKTDRGRVSVLYGAPDEVERVPSSAESNPYEIWHYNSLQGGVIFVFVDRNGMGDYLQVHSTHRDELHDENWFQQWAQKMH